MPQQTQAMVNQETYQRLCRARDFIDSHYALPLKLDQISDQACFSRYYFIRLFRQVFQQTPHQYLTGKRIERAKELLAVGQMSVTEICFEVGFESLGSFSSLFRKYVGHSPGVYRTRLIMMQHAPVPACFLIRFGFIPASA